MGFVRGSVVGVAALSCALALLSGSVLASSDSPSSSCIASFISDGDCDLVNDTAECGRWRFAFGDWSTLSYEACHVLHGRDTAVYIGHLDKKHESWLRLSFVFEIGCFLQQISR